MVSAVEGYIRSPEAKEFIMLVRVLPLCLVAFVAALFLSQPARADDKMTQEGSFVSYVNNKLLITDKDGKEHTYTLAANAKITLDGKDAKMEDFKKGNHVTVTTKKEAPNAAVEVDGKTK
jgi:hypothetical protein